ncbi:MAG TPA: hypothetical protein VFC93_08710 [Chloroflexota bacterium]|nr:hypothetical protein [Chloroflexota bacterium]
MSHRKLFKGVLALMALGVLVVGALLSAAPVGAAAVILTPTSGLTGTQVNAAGTGYQPGETVRIIFGNFYGTDVADATADNDGAFSVNFAVPTVDALGSAVVAGQTYNVYALGATSSNQASATFTVTGIAPTATPTATRTPTATATRTPTVGSGASATAAATTVATATSTVTPTPTATPTQIPQRELVVDGGFENGGYGFVPIGTFGYVSAPVHSGVKAAHFGPNGGGIRSPPILIPFDASLVAVKFWYLFPVSSQDPLQLLVVDVGTGQTLTSTAISSSGKTLGQWYQFDGTSLGATLAAQARGRSISIEVRIVASSQDPGGASLDEAVIDDLSLVADGRFRAFVPEMVRTGYLDDTTVLIANATANDVTEVRRDGKIVWQLTGLSDPLRAERLDNGNTLVVDAGNSRVAEFTKDKQLVATYPVVGAPVSAHRLANGNTLIATDDSPYSRVFELTPDKSIAWSYRYDRCTFANGQPYCVGKVADAIRLANGDTLLAVADSGVGLVEVSPAGTTVAQTQVTGANGVAMPVYAVQELDNGDRLVTTSQVLGARVVELNPSGQAVWSYGLDAFADGALYLPRDAVRTRTGTTLIADYGKDRIIEVSNGGQIVWQYNRASSGPYSVREVPPGLSYR